MEVAKLKPKVEMGMEEGISFQQFLKTMLLEAPPAPKSLDVSSYSNKSIRMSSKLAKPMPKEI